MPTNAVFRIEFRYYGCAAVAGSPYTPVQFVDLPPADIFALDFRRDSEWIGGEQYIDIRPANG